VISLLKSYYACHHLINNHFDVGRNISAQSVDFRSKIEAVYDGGVVVFSATIRIYIGSYSSCFGIQPLDF
jgi:hypothetical protein